MLAKQKYYAVKHGRKTGIFYSWEDCKEQIERFPNAVYKGFTLLQEAKNYLLIDTNCVTSMKNSKETKANQNTLTAYVDGSFSAELNRYSYGCVLLHGDTVVNLSGSDNEANYVKMRNVAGELLGAIKSTQYAHENNFNSIVIYHDYQGIAKWATGEWKATKAGTQEYQQFINNYKNLINIRFQKVQAHSGDKYNDEADRLAKEALQL